MMNRNSDKASVPGVTAEAIVHDILCIERLENSMYHSELQITGTIRITDYYWLS